MTLQPIFVEQYRESRKQSVTKDSISKTLIYKVTADWFDDTVERSWGGVTEWDDDELVNQVVYTTFPWYREFPLATGGYVLLLLASSEIEQINDTTWMVTLVYELPTNNGGFSGDINALYQDYNLGPDAGENGGSGWSDELTQLSFNSSCKEVHKTTSRALTAKHKASWLPAGISLPSNMVLDRPAPVGLTNDGIKGYDVYERQFEFQITQYFSPTKLTYSYVRLLYKITGTLNASVFFGFPIGSVLFLGAQAEGNLVQNVPVTFNFAVRNNYRFTQGTTTLCDPNQTDPALMFDKLSDPYFDEGNTTLSGWTVVDYHYIPLPDTAAKTVIARPAFRYVHTVYEFSDFSKLRL